MNEFSTVTKKVRQWYNEPHKKIQDFSYSVEVDLYRLKKSPFWGPSLKNLA